MINCKQLTVIIIAALTTACASTPAEKQPELLSAADSAISHGVTEYNQANYARAILLFEQALYQYRRIDNPDGTAAAYINLANAELSQNQPARAEHWLQQAQQIVEREQLSALHDRIAITASSIAIERKDFAGAKALLTNLLTASDPETLLAAVQNRTRIAFAEDEQAHEWSERYAQLVSNNPLARARLNRFRAALIADTTEQDKHYQLALSVYRELAWRPGLAATLSEWAEQNLKAQNYPGAQNKLERALLIRIDLRDHRATVALLQELEKIYAETGHAAKQQRTSYWQALVAQERFDSWDKIMQDFEN